MEGVGNGRRNWRDSDQAMSKAAFVKFVVAKLGNGELVRLSDH